ncbi:MAG: DASH family cryptochrome [Rubricoccaceae bacterium]
MATHLLWLRNDLRVDDHPALLAALRGAGALVPVYVLDDRLFAPTRWGFPKTGAFRARFLLESLRDLRASLRARGSDLVVRRGAPADVLPALARETGAAAVFAHAEPMTEEQADEAAVREALGGVPLRTGWAHTLLHPDDLPFALDRLPGVFTAFRKAVERAWRVRPAREAPEALPPLPGGLAPGDLPADVGVFGLEPQTPDPRAVPFAGGETAARARLQRYVWQDDRLRVYKETRNGLVGDDFASRLSPYLAHGALSPRRVYAEVKRYERERVANESTYWLVFELLWRDYFRFYGAQQGARLFWAAGPRARGGAQPFHAPLFEAWTAGQTGYPFVDAAMRELAGSGFMSNRARQNAASFWARTLGQDWRAGAAWFESLLVDYDVTSNWGNWAYVAGTGNDPRDRTFNVVRQAQMYDADGAFMRRWVPELAAVPDRHLPAPWTLPADVARRAGVRLGVNYPNPVVRPDGQTRPEPKAERSRRS